MNPIKIKRAKFFRPVRPSKDQLQMINIEGASSLTQEAFFHPNIGLIVTRRDKRTKEDYQFIVPINNIESLVPIDIIRVNESTEPKAEPKKAGRPAKKAKDE